MSLVLKKAPKFSASAVVNGSEITQGFSLEQYIGEKNVVFFFYPKAFTSVCTSEIQAFQEKLAEFEKRDTVVVACSTDSSDSLLAWTNTPAAKGGAEGVTYPIVADEAKTIAYNFGVLGGDYEYDEEGNLAFEGAPIALRGTFLIDKQGIIQHSLVNSYPLGRNVQDTLKMVDVLNHFQENGEACLANWEAEVAEVV